MRFLPVAALAFWHGIVIDFVAASPVNHHVLPRQDTSTSSSSSVVITSTAAPASAAAPTSASVTASVTLFQNQANVFQAAPSTTANPTSGCALYSQQATTIITTNVISAGAVATVSQNIVLTEGLYCDCMFSSSSITVLVGTSYDEAGTAYVYCQTNGGVPTGTGILSTGSPQASALPGDALNPDWIDVSCTYGSIPDPDYNADPWTQWNDTGAEAAWEAMVATWNIREDTTDLTFSAFVFEFFNGPHDPQCDNIAEGSCDNSLNCGQVAYPNAPASSPAGWLIMSSMVNVHRVMEQFQSAVEAAVGQIGIALPAFTSKSPFPFKRPDTLTH